MTPRSADTRPFPFGMCIRDSRLPEARGYTPYPTSWGYDPRTQVSELLRMGGKTEPTTVSTCADTTGIINTDSDDSNDDTGTD